MTLATSLGSLMITAFIVLAVVASVGSLAVITGFLVSNRRVRLARRQSIGTYYRGLALTH